MRMSFKSRIKQVTLLATTMMRIIVHRYDLIKGGFKSKIHMRAHFLPGGAPPTFVGSQVAVSEE